MKRCPQCLFIYPETDERCDFDKTPLVAVADSEIDAAAKPSSKRNRGLVLIAGAVVIAFVVTFAVYYFKSRSEEQVSPDIPVVAVAPAVPEPPQPSPSPSPSPSPTATPKPSPSRVATSHTTTSLDPVSTSGPARNGGKSVILLTSGGKIEADEVWRTRDGIWYRRNGIVTLLKRARVKAIVNR
jgi:hypothetical protein